VSVLPDWLVEESAAGMPILTVRIGASGLHKNINVGMRRTDVGTDYLGGFLEIAKLVGTEG
jgi:LysR family transcriptional regulator for metE and metH